VTPPGERGRWLSGRETLWWDGNRQDVCMRGERAPGLETGFTTYQPPLCLCSFGLSWVSVLIYHENNNSTNTAGVLSSWRIHVYKHVCIAWLTLGTLAIIITVLHYYYTSECCYKPESKLKWGSLAMCQDHTVPSQSPNREMTFRQWNWPNNSM
jgi:hypothetical protein